MKNILIAVVAVLIFNVIFVFSGGLDLLVKTEQKESIPLAVSPNVVDVFKFTLEEEVQKKIGMPVEGYEPQMFLQVFPGLADTDFEGVDASSGYYTVDNGKIALKLDDSGLVHSAAGAITRDGIETLLYNVANRIGVDLKGEGTITDIMAAIVPRV